MYELSFSRDSIRRLEGLAKAFPVVFRDEALKTLNLIDARLTKEIIEKTPRGVGGQAGLAGSIFGQVRQLGDTYIDRISTPLEYGLVVELGRRPGARRPPTGPIALWARRKLGLGEKEARRAAFAIAVAIGRRGIKGKFMFKKTRDERAAWVREQLAGLPDRIVRRIDGSK